MGLTGSRNMLKVLWSWIDGLKSQQRLCRQDARLLLARNPNTAFYDAQRLVAQARFACDGRAFRYWTLVAAEVARISDNPMDIEVIEVIVEEERRRAVK